MIEDGVLEDLLDILIANLGRVVPRGSQVLPTVHCQIYLSVSKVFWLVVGKEKDGTVADTTSHLRLMLPLSLIAEYSFVEVGTCDPWCAAFHLRESPVSLLRELLQLDMCLSLRRRWEAVLSLV